MWPHQAAAHGRCGLPSRNQATKLQITRGLIDENVHAATNSSLACQAVTSCTAQLLDHQQGHHRHSKPLAEAGLVAPELTALPKSDRSGRTDV